jgi:hypothetical protein
MPMPNSILSNGGTHLLQGDFVSLTMIGLAFLFLYLAIKSRQRHKPKENYNVQRGIAGYKIFFNMGDGWVLFTFFIGCQRLQHTF